MAHHRERHEARYADMSIELVEEVDEAPVEIVSSGEEGGPPEGV